MIEEKTVQLLVKLPESMKTALDACAKAQDLTTSQVLRQLIREYVNKNYQQDLFSEKKPRKK